MNVKGEILIVDDQPNALKVLSAKWVGVSPAKPYNITPVKTEKSVLQCSSCVRRT